MATKVVILEDEALIAVELEDQLRDAGFQVTGTFSPPLAHWISFGINYPMSLSWISSYGMATAQKSLNFSIRTTFPSAYIRPVWPPQG